MGLIRKLRYFSFTRTKKERQVILILIAFSIVLVFFFSSPQSKIWENQLNNVNNALHLKSKYDQSSPDFQEYHNEVEGKDKVHFIPRKELETFDSLKIFPNMEFDVNWTKKEEYFWNDNFEKRFKEQKQKYPLKIVVVPHSHNDPGWGWTIEEYYEMRTHNILKNAMKKMVQHKEMRFLWSEASYLDVWWKDASEKEKETMRQLIKEGRLEIVTGGWVMTDEAIVHLYSMIDQLIEGQHWVKDNLDYLPETSWSVDPFGHGNVFPYILKKSKIENMVILRIHYAWKKWLGQEKNGDFNWVQRWDTLQENSVFCHQAPYYMYLIPNSLGPHSKKCEKFHFTDKKNGRVTNENLVELSELFIEEGGRTASMTRSNVILVILGEDFAMQREDNWDDFYTNFMKIFEYINSNKEKYNVEAGFGTVKDYFKAVKEREVDYSSFKGDFFVYSDVFHKDLHRPAYWSGFYTSRPVYKKLYRQTENLLRSAEILASFTSFYNPDKNSKFLNEKIYGSLTIGRRQHHLFSHHDGVPGVSNSRVMRNFGEKLQESARSTLYVQEEALKYLLELGNGSEIESLQEVPKKGDQVIHFKTLTFDKEKEKKKKIVVFNSLGWKSQFLIKLPINEQIVRVIADFNGHSIPSQLNPIFDKEKGISDSFFELNFLAELDPLSISVFTIELCQDNSDNKAIKPKIKFNSENSPKNFLIEQLNFEKDLYLKNDKLELSFNNQGFLSKIKTAEAEIEANMEFGTYSSVPYKSGPYLFMQNGTVKMIPSKEEISKKILIKVVGPILSSILASYGRIEQKIEILETGYEKNKHNLFLENTVDATDETGEYFLRINTNMDTNSKTEKIEKGVKMSLPTFYTDQNGFSFEKRIKIDEIGIEGNYYPATTMAFIQQLDKNLRLSLLLEKAGGVSSFENGRIETMIERRVMTDDDRGIGQGVYDNVKLTSSFILTLEKMPENLENFENAKGYSVPSLETHHLSQQLNYPPIIFIAKNSETFSPKMNLLTLFNNPLPADTHLITSRLINEKEPGKVLSIFQKLGHTCSPSSSSCNNNLESELFYSETKYTLKNSKIKSFSKSDITGLRIPKNNLKSTDIYQFKSKPFELNSFISEFEL